MRLLNAALVLGALLATLGGYLQEKKRLATIQALPPAEARALYEKAQLKRERIMIAVTAVLVAAAALALMLFKVRR
jgi:hypothetical protein